MLILLAILFPILAGVAGYRVRPFRRWYYIAVILITDVLGLAAAIRGGSLTLFRLTESVPLTFSPDPTGTVYLLLVLLLYTAGCFYSFEYFAGDDRLRSFFGFWFASMGAMLAVTMAANLVSLYLCFEMATLMSMPMVLHDRTKESISAARKYLFYSIGGALLGLFAVFTLSYYGAVDFVAGGSLAADAASPLVPAAVFVGIVGFGAKAGMYPLHGWLPAAHPVAPAPASAVLSGVIAKAGILAVIRLVYFTAGPALLAGTWAQIAWMILALITVFMGSMMAYREKVLKKRLAYSTVSQLSYIMLSLSLLTDDGLRGALLHTMAHACAKCALFLCAGVFIHCLHKHRVEELRGVGKQMPVTVWCFLLSGLSLIGIPPFGGFISKWSISLAAISQAPGPFKLLIPGMLLLSALLTAGYLLPPVIDAFYPPKGEVLPAEKAEPSGWMIIPLVLLCCGSLAVGLFGSLWV